MSRAGEQLLLIALLVAIYVLAHRRPTLPTAGTHGRATWLSERAMFRAGLLGTVGLILGRTLQRGALIRLPDYTHTLVIGTTGSGKGVSIVLPNLLRGYCHHSCVVFDPKGDLFAIAGPVRARMGQRILRIAPYTGGPDSLNPLDSIPADSPTLIEDAHAIAEDLVIRAESSTADPHWDASAALVIRAAIVIVLLTFKQSQRNLNAVKDIISDAELLDSAAAKLIEIGGIPGRMGHYLRGLKQTEKEAASIRSTVARQLAWLDSGLVGHAVATSSFDPSDLKKPGTTLFLQIEPRYLQQSRGLLRCLVGSLIRVLGQHNGPAGEVLFLLDEASALGDLSGLEEVLVRGRSTGSTGIRLLLAYQGDSQVQAAFKEKPTLIYDNTSTKVYIGPADSLESAQRISGMLGAATVSVESVNLGDSESWPTGVIDDQGSGGQRSRSTGSNWAPHERPLLRPEEVLTLDPDLLICFRRGSAPILARRVKYYADPAFETAPERCDRASPALWVALALAVVLIVAALVAP